MAEKVITKPEKAEEQIIEKESAFLVPKPTSVTAEDIQVKRFWNEVSIPAQKVEVVEMGFRSCRTS